MRNHRTTGKIIATTMTALMIAGGVIAAERSERTGPPDTDGAAFIKRLDADGDGKVSKAEFDGPAEHFTKSDANGDGYISEAEAPTGPPPGRQGGGRGGQGQR